MQIWLLLFGFLSIGIERTPSNSNGNTYLAILPLLVSLFTFGLSFFHLSYLSCNERSWSMVHAWPLNFLWHWLWCDGIDVDVDADADDKWVFSLIRLHNVVIVVFVVVSFFYLGLLSGNVCHNKKVKANWNSIPYCENKP